VLGRPDRADDSRVSTNIAPCAERDLLDEPIGAWTRQHPLAEIQSVADAGGIGHSRYNTVKDAINRAQLERRNRWQSVGSPVGLTLSLLARPKPEG